MNGLLQTLGLAAPPRSVLQPGALPTSAGSQRPGHLPTFAPTKGLQPGALPTQAGARMPFQPRDHELALASAAHLHRMGHLDDDQLSRIRAHAQSQLGATNPTPQMPGPRAAMAPMSLAPARPA